MILRALFDLAHTEGLLEDPDYESKPVAYLVRVAAGGRLLGIESTREFIAAEAADKKKPKPIVRQFKVPREPARTSGDRAFLLVDKADYVFGQSVPSEQGKFPLAKLQNRFGLFRERVAACLAATQDPGVAAVDAFLAAVASQEFTVELPADCAGNDLFAFVYELEPHLVTAREKVRAYWQAQRQQGQASVDDPLCLVTGRRAPTADQHTVIKYVPGASTAGVRLVSFNASAFESYGFKGNENANISREAAEGYATALQRLLHPAPAGGRKPQNQRLSDDTVVCYWTAQESDFAGVLSGLFEANPDSVGELYQSIWHGRAPDRVDPNAFYALTLTGAQGRVIVRDWFESTVGEVQDHLARFFSDLAVVRNTPKPKQRELSPHLPLRVLLGSLAPQGKSENVPKHFASELVHSALSGVPFPFALLIRAIERSRAEIGASSWSDFERRDARAALIKAVLNRRRSTTTPDYPEIQPAMDPENTNPGYLLGRLMALLERLQQLALGDINASVVDRYFSAASATPRLVFTRLLKNARHHAKKAMDEPRSRATAIWLERQLDTISSRFPVSAGGFPAHLSLEEQGLFILGFHQQRHQLFTKADKTAADQAAASDLENSI